MTISQVSKEYDISQDTLRYYEKIGLIPHISRDKSGKRDYDESACGRISFIKCMRAAGMPIDKLIKYFELLNEGEGTLEKRMNLLKEQRADMQRQKENIEASIEKMDNKLKLYAEILEGKRQDFVN